jgi:hypothetical protein
MSAADTATRFLAAVRFSAPPLEARFQVPACRLCVQVPRDPSQGPTTRSPDRGRLRHRRGQCGVLDACGPQARLSIRPQLPFVTERTDVLTCQSETDNENINLIATLLSHPDASEVAATLRLIQDLDKAD